MFPVDDDDAFAPRDMPADITAQFSNPNTELPTVAPYLTIPEADAVETGGPRIYMATAADTGGTPWVLIGLAAVAFLLLSRGRA